MSNSSKGNYKPCNPCRPQLYKIVKYNYYRYPTKYICTPVEWDTKCEKQVIWEPEKPYPPVKVCCEQLRQSYCGKEDQYYPEPEKGYAQDNSCYEKGYAQDNSYFESDDYSPEYQYSDDAE